jgi:hypothetical protein
MQSYQKKNSKRATKEKEEKYSHLDKHVES